VQAEGLGLAETPGPDELAVVDVAFESGPVRIELVALSCYHPVPLYGTEFHYVEQQ
jgi:hypothetical protein